MGSGEEEKLQSLSDEKDSPAVVLHAQTESDIEAPGPKDSQIGPVAYIRIIAERWQIVEKIGKGG
ncbi:MAG: hypothetical protein ACRD3W_18105, partial [Terriglobales bacterium]